MPLIKGKSKKAFGKNVEAEMDAGKPQSQALAIAYNTKRKAQKMARGGMVGSHQSPGAGHTIHINVHPQGEYAPPGGDYAEGGDVMKDLPPKKQEPLPPQDEQYADGGMVDGSHQSEAHEMDMVDRIMARRMPSHETMGAYSKGGMVANEDSGESTSEPTYAKADPNEFDDLALRDDLESSYTGENSGDEDGSELNQTDDGEDMIDRIMKKRSKK